jgi:hypothetical protein
MLETPFLTCYGQANRNGHFTVLFPGSGSKKVPILNTHRLILVKQCNRKARAAKAIAGLYERQFLITDVAAAINIAPIDPAKRAPKRKLLF